MKPGADGGGGCAFDWYGGKQGKGTYLYPLLSGTILTFVLVLFFALLLLNIFSTITFSENCFATISFSKSTTLGGCLPPLVCFHTCTCISPPPHSHKTILLTVDSHCIECWEYKEIRYNSTCPLGICIQHNDNIWEQGRHMHSISVWADQVLYSFILQLPLIEAPTQVLDFCVMKPGMVPTFLELLIK